MSKNFLVSRDDYKKDYQINPDTNNLAIIFGPQNLFSKALTAELKKQNPKIKVVGLGTSNNFTGSETGNGDQLSLAVLEFKKTDVETICLPNQDYTTSLATAQALADHLVSKQTKEKPLKGVLIFAEGLNINGADLPRPFESLGIPVCGGLAAETDFAFKQTQIFFDGEEKSNHVIAVGFYGESFSMESTASSGMEAKGAFKTITKSDKNVLYKVGDQTAVEWYTSFLREKGQLKSDNTVEQSQALSHPVAIFKNEKTADGAIRTPIGFDYVQGSIAFTGEIPEGYSLRMMLANPTELINGADGLLESQSDDSCSYIHISCSARQMLLANLTSYEYASAKPCLGGYVYGEIATLNGKPELLNQTFTSIKIKEVA